VADVVVAAPILYSKAQFTHSGANWAGETRGVTPDYFVARDWPAADGRPLTENDQRRAEKVVWLGATVREMLFEDADPIGALVRIRDVPFTVAGVLARKGQNVQGDDQDDIALIPLSTARQQLVGVSRASPRAVHSIFVKFAEGADVDSIMRATADLLRQRHRLQAGQEDSFILRNLAEVANVEKAAARVLSLLLAAVASVSLLVGGIGIMNIMLVSVTERTREIGLRMAVGARGRDIVAQFLTEAVTLAAIGGGIGALAGIAGAFAMAALAGWPVLVDAGAVILAVAFSGAVGVFFGLYPARRAARLDPMAALRAE
jgi:putative ABC transport system permease protein